MSEIKGRRISIQSGPGSFGAVDLDGMDISSAVRGATLRVEAGKVAAVTLDLRILDQATADATDVAVRIPEMTRQALIDLGWTPPAS